MDDQPARLWDSTALSLNRTSIQAYKGGDQLLRVFRKLPLCREACVTLMESLIGLSRFLRSASMVERVEDSDLVDSETCLVSCVAGRIDASLQAFALQRFLDPPRAFPIPMLILLILIL